MNTTFKTDTKGNVIDPPVLPEFEVKLTAAAATGDDDKVKAVSAEYDKERRKVAGVSTGTTAKTTTKKSTGGSSRSRSSSASASKSRKSGGASR